VVSVTDFYDRVLGFLDRSCYFFQQVDPQLYSRGLVEPVTDPLLLSKFASGGNRTCTSGSVARNSGIQNRGPGSILGATRKKCSGSGTGSTRPRVSTTEELLDRKVAVPVYKTENTAVGIHHANHVAPSILKSWQSLRRQAAVARSV
jgi:hypothetical protein